MPRLNHKKSRKGCQRCRERKVKCDEKQPVCGACDRHGVACHFDSKFVFVETSSVGRPSRPLSAAARLPLSGNDEGDKLLELRLMHHYSVSAYSALPSSDATDVWQCYVPELAFHQPYLLNAVLSFSALHLYRFGDQPDRHRCWTTHQLYFGRALQQHRTAISEFVEHRNRDAHVLAVAMITWQAFLLVDHHKQPYEFPLTWLSFACYTYGALFSKCWWQGDHGRLAPFFDSLSVCFHHRMEDEQYRSAFLSSDPAWASFEEGDPLERYDTWIRCMGVVHLAVKEQHSNQAICRFLLSIPCQVGPVLLEMLRNRRPRAVAMLGHMFCILKKHEHQYLWQLHIPDMHVKGIDPMLTQKWKEAMHNTPRPE